MNSAYPTSQVKPRRFLPPGLPYLVANTMSDSLQLGKLHIWSSLESALDETSTAAYFPHNQSFTKEEKERADAWALSSWISGRVFFLYPPVDSLSDSSKTHPSLVCLSFMELAGDIFDTHWPWELFFKVFNCPQIREWITQQSIHLFFS